MQKKKFGRKIRAKNRAQNSGKNSGKNLGKNRAKNSGKNRAQKFCAGTAIPYTTLPLPTRVSVIFINEN